MSEPGLHEIAPGVHAWIQPDGTWWINNAGAVVITESTILIDTCATARRTTLFLDAVRAVSGDAPISFAVNTHLHGDHTYGNILLPDSTAIVAHRATRDGLLADFLLTNTPPVWSPTPDWGVTEVRAATVVLDSSLSLFAGSTEVQLYHPGHAAHTQGDVVAWIPAASVLFTGDLIFHQGTPLVFMGSIPGAIRSIEWLRTFPAETIVPGHGPLIRGEDFTDVLDLHHRYYTFIQTTAENALAKGLTPLQAAQEADLGEFQPLADPERIVLNLHRALAELQNTDLNLLTAFTDAITYNGGPLHTHV